MRSNRGFNNTCAERHDVCPSLRNGLHFERAQLARTSCPAQRASWHFFLLVHMSRGSVIVIHNGTLRVSNIMLQRVIIGFLRAATICIAVQVLTSAITRASSSPSTRTTTHIVRHQNQRQQSEQLHPIQCSINTVSEATRHYCNLTQSKSREAYGKRRLRQGCTGPSPQACAGPRSG